MTVTTLQTRLRQAISSPDFMGELNSITNDLKDSHADINSVEPILRFMEENPALDFGSPGPLVHFVEKFYRAGYEAELLASLKRHPTSHTIWMLNRIINGTKDPNARNSLAGALKAAGQHSLADDATRALVSRFVSRL